MDIENLATDIIDGRRINLKYGSLSLAKATGAEMKREQVDVMGLLVVEGRMGKTDERHAAIVNAERTVVPAYLLGVTFGRVS